MKKHIKSNIILVLSILGICVGLALIFNGQIKNALVHQNQVAGMKNITKQTIKKNQTKKTNYDFSKVDSLGWKEVAESRTSKNRYDYGIGAISIPSVGMILPIEKGLNNSNMAIGGCTMRPDQIMGKGNYPLAGHYMTSSGGLFSPLENVKIGDNVYLTDLKTIYTYQINMKKIVEPTAVWLVNNTSTPMVTLITCADGGQKRWALRGTLVAQEPATTQKLKNLNFQN